jgi:hypothetical protein
VVGHSYTSAHVAGGKGETERGRDREIERERKGVKRERKGVKREREIILSVAVGVPWRAKCPFGRDQCRLKSGRALTLWPAV